MGTRASIAVPELWLDYSLRSPPADPSLKASADKMGQGTVDSSDDLGVDMKMVGPQGFEP